MAAGIVELFSKFTILILIINSVNSFDQNNDSGFTITISPGGTECFYQTAKSGEVIEVEYQVIDSAYGNGNIGQGDLYINFLLNSPSGKVLITESQKGDAIHRHDVQEDGDHKICLDNKASRFAHKTVYLDVYVDTDESDDTGWDDVDFAPELTYNDSIEVIKARANKIRDHLQQIEHFQSQRKANEARDRNLQEHNFNMVNMFSLLSIIVLLTVGSIQVFMVRSLFEERSKLHKIFKLLS